MHTAAQHSALRPILLVSVLTVATAVGACRGEGPGGPGRPGGAAMAVPVEMKTLAPSEIERTTDYVATVKSRRSATIQPQVEGVVTRILVRSGDRARAGQPLVEIDPRRQEAAVATSESDRQARDAAATFATSELARAKALLKDGIISKADLDAKQNAYDQAASAVTTLDARVSQERINLQYFTVRATAAGIVGDIPVRVGDRVTTSTMLTTIESTEGLEAYVQVPIDRASDLKPGMAVRVLDAGGRAVETGKVSFISDLTESTAQTVLVKVPLANPAGVLRPSQFVRARIVWGTEQVLTIPLTSVVRINGQYFGFVAEARGPGAVARQRRLTVGDVVGNDYVVRAGLTPGDRVITGGVQKLRDGVPVMAMPAPAPAAKS